MEFSLFDYLVLPILIMIARITDVSMDTIRVIMVAKGYRKYAPVIGFFQSLIWLITISRIMVNLENWTAYLGYAAGFGLGTYVGMRIEEKLALGYELIRVITRTNADSLIATLRKEGYPVTSADGEGKDGKVGILFVILQRREMKKVIEIINAFNPKAFYTVEDMRFVHNSSYLPRARRIIGGRGPSR